MSLRIVFYTMIVQMKQSFVRPMYRFCLLINPIVNTVLLYEMYKNSGYDNFFAYVTIGAGLMGVWSCICFSSAGDINRERYSGTLSLIFASPAKFSVIIFGKIFGNTIMSLFSFVLSVLFSIFFLGMDITVVNMGKFILAMGLTIVSFVIISIVIAYILTLSRKSELYMNLIEIPFILLCGFAYPVTILPVFAQKISGLLPPTIAIELLRESVLNEYGSAYFTEHIIKLVVLCIVYSFGAAILYKIIVKHVRCTGSLDIV